MYTALRSRSGRLTPYGFACGYVERAGDRDSGVVTEMYHSHGAYHVRRFDRRPGAPIFRVFWEVFRGKHGFREARSLFDSSARE